MKPRRGAMIIDKQVNMPTNPEGVKYFKPFPYRLL